MLITSPATHDNMLLLLLLLLLPPADAFAAAAAAAFIAAAHICSYAIMSMHPCRLVQPPHTADHY
jgi:hypothetical protein